MTKPEETKCRIIVVVSLVSLIMFIAFGFGSVIRFENECKNHLNGFVVLSPVLRPVCIKQTAVVDL